MTTSTTKRQRTAVPEPVTQVTEPEPNELVWALLDGAATAILGTQAVFQGEAHKVTFSVVKTAAAARNGVWQYKRLEGDTYRAL